MAPSLAWAACPTPYTLDALLNDLALTETALRENNDTGASEAAAKLGAGLGCLDDIMPFAITARTYRAVAGGLHLTGDQAAAEKWFLTSLEINPTWEYGLQDLPITHAVRDAFDTARSRAAVDPLTVEGMLFKDGEYYLNGRKITRPQARPGRFHVFQAQTSTLATDVIDGNAFPPAVLVAAPAEASPVAAAGKKPKKPKKEKGPKAVKEPKPPKGSGDTVADAKPPKPAKPPKQGKMIEVKQADGTVVLVPKDRREMPPEKIPFIVGGISLIAGSGVLYYLANTVQQKHRTINSIKAGEHMATINAAYDYNTDSPWANDPPMFCDKGIKIGTNECAVSPQNESERLQRVNQRLILAAATVLAVGVGATTWGIMVDDSGVVMPSVSFGF